MEKKSSRLQKNFTRKGKQNYWLVKFS